jgi:hypothetical protein
MQRTKFNRLSTAMDWIAELLRSIGAKPETPVINLSGLSGEIAFSLRGQRWKLTLAEAKPDETIAKLMQAEVRGRVN